MPDAIASVRPFFFEIPRDQPYLGDLRPGETANSRGYFVRGGNRTVYPSTDRSVILRIETSDGVVGWGETYGIVAPGAVMEIIRDLFTEFLVGRDPRDVSVIYEDLYDLMRVRGQAGGFYHDALAAVDIALWDICGKLSGLPVAKLLGGRRHAAIPAYVSGLPGKDEAARLDLARHWQGRGFNRFKFATPAVDDTVREFAILRAGLGPDAEIAADLHWGHTAAEAVALSARIAPSRPWFIEAPCQPEDSAALGEVTRRSLVPVAAGEEWRQVFDLKDRLEQGGPNIFQPEMGHVGITQFMRMAGLAAAHNLRIMPHATIGLGIFLAASLQASAAIQAVVAHEFQHTVVDRADSYVIGGPRASDGFYDVPARPGLGIEPTAEVIALFKE